MFNLSIIFYFFLAWSSYLSFSHFFSSFSLPLLHRRHVSSSLFLLFLFFAFFKIQWPLELSLYSGVCSFCIPKPHEFHELSSTLIFRKHLNALLLIKVWKLWSFLDNSFPDVSAVYALIFFDEPRTIKGKFGRNIGACYSLFITCKYILFLIPAVLIVLVVAIVITMIFNCSITMHDTDALALL